MNTNIIQDTLNDSKNLLMPVIATLLSCTKPMICSNYDKSQDASVELLGVIKNLYWEEILKTCGMPVNSYTEEDELKRIKSAQKARNLLVDIAMNVTGAKIS
uniref:Phage protein n=1 Tax=Strongyloides papillosus TaxID=174720 RepID=A0A0N5BXX9_STREA